MRLRPRAVSVCASLALFAVTGCGGSQSGSAVTVSGTKLTIYASQPPSGARSQADRDVLDAERLAFGQAGAKQVGKFTLRLRVLDGAKLTDNARTAIQDKSAIAYLGELEPGTSQQSVEITNQLDLLEVSPTDTAVYLTQSTPAVSGAPGRYYPLGSSYHGTFARVVPNTAKEAKALVAEMHSLHLAKLDVISDGQPYGASLALAVRHDAPAQGLSLVSAAAGADAVLYAGNGAPAAIRALDRAAAAAPGAKLFAPSALYSGTFVDGLTAAAQGSVYVSSPGFTGSGLSASGRQFVSSFQSAYGHAPAPQAIFGYEAMSAVLAVLKQAGAHANERTTVVSDFQSLKNRQSVLETYSIQGGDTTLAPFVFARVKGGRLVPGSQG